MRGRRSRVLALGLAVLFAALYAPVGARSAAAQAAVPSRAPGRIEGRVQRPDGSGVAGVLVAVDLGTDGKRISVTTGSDGAFRLGPLAAGTYTVSFTLGDHHATEEGVEVAAGEVRELAETVDWMYSLAETLTVYAVSRRTERLVDAPAAVSVVPPETIEREAATGQLPKLLESLPGAEITQSGLFDFKLNVRGINGTINRRVAVLIDGRNPSFPILDTQEWYAVSFPLDDIASAELVRGPSSALYGANAFNGVLNLTTRAPEDTLGGFARLTGGDLATGRFDFRVSRKLGEGLFLKAMGGYHRSEDFYRSRNRTLEYSQPCTATLTTDCLYLEAAPLALDEDRIGFGGLRLDKDFDQRRSLVMEVGYSDSEGPVFATNAGRFQLLGVRRPWARVDFHTPRWNLLTYYNDRDAEALTLAAGTPSYADSYRAAAELQGWWQLGGGRGRLVAGAWASDERVDTANPQGIQTLLLDVSGARKRAVFGQLDWDLSDTVKVVGAVRWDDSSLHAAQVSPKASLVWAIHPRHTLRLSYNEAFESPNYPEFFLRVPLAPPIDLSAFEGFCGAVDCGFGRPVELLAVGNDDLDVESIRSAELGYTAVVGNRTYLTATYYRTQIRDFVQVLVPQLGTRLGRVNPDFQPYRPPSALPQDNANALLAALASGLGPLFPLLSNDLRTGDPILALSTIANFGHVETQGLELTFDRSIGRGWGLELNYAGLDFKLKDELPEAPIEANGPDHKVNLGLTYDRDRVSASVHYRWVSSFRWAEGLLRGPVPSYQVVNLAALYRLSSTWKVGIDVSNLFDDRHYEAFSGDVLERRVLGHVGFSW